MKIVQATKEHKEIVLDLLDEFKAVIYSTYDDKYRHEKKIDTAMYEMFDTVIDLPYYAVFLAYEWETYVWVVTMSKIPQLRKWLWYVEIEELFVLQEFQWSGAAQWLLSAVEKTAKDRKVEQIRLESWHHLERAHAFYEKCWFENYGSAYKKYV